MDSYSVQAVLSVKDKNFTSSMKSAQSVLSGLDSSSQKSSSSVGALGTAFAVAQTVVSAACNVIKNSVSEAVARVDTLNQYPKIMEQMGFSSEQAEASVQKLSDGIQGLPTSLDTIVDSAQNIALITGNIDEATDVALALNNALIASGASTEEASRATEQYDKMLSTGKVTSQQWTTLEQDMKYALIQVAEQLGITSGSTQELYSAMQTGQITFDEFNAALIECSEAEGGFAEMAQTASAGIATSWENVKTAVVRGVANMIEAWNEAAADNGIPTIQESLNGLRGVVDTVFNAASKAITVFVNNLDLIVGACAPVVAALAGLKIAQTVSSYFKQFQDSGKKAAEALKSYSDKAKDAEKASQNLKTAEEALKSAMDKEQSAYQNAIDAAGKLSEAEKKVEDATKARNDAQEAANSGTEDAAKASETLQQAEAALNQAEQELAQAKQENVSAEQAYSEAKQVTAAATELDTAAQEENAAAVEGTTLAEIAQNAILAALSGEMTIAAAAQEALNAAMAANPIGLVVTAISALVSVLSVVINLMKKFSGETESAYKSAKNMKSEVEDLAEAWDEERSSQQESITATENNARANQELCNRVEELLSKESLTSAETATLNSYLDTLNGRVDGLDASYDALTGSMNMSYDAMQKQVEAADKLAQYQDKQDAYNDSLTRQGEIQDQIAEKTAALTELEAQQTEAAQTGAIYGVAAKKEIQAAIEELEAQEQEEADLQTQLLDEMGVSQEEYTALVQEAYAAQSAAIDEAVANQTLTLDMLSEENQATAQELQSTWQDYTDIATDMFDTLDTEVSVTVDDMIENMQRNQEIMAQWGDNTEALRDRFANLGLDPAILDQLVDLGPEGAGYIQELVDASDDKLIELADTYAEGGETAYTAMGQSLGEGAAEVMDQAKNLITQTEDSLRAQVEATSWDDVGTSIDQGVGEGIESSVSFPQASATTAMGLIYDAAAAAIGMGSPAAEWVPIGESMDEGVGKGLEESTAAQEAAMQMVEELLQTVEEAIEGADFSAATETMWDGMSEATTTGMSQIEQAVTSGMDTVSSAITNGFTNMGSSVSSEMSTIASVVSSGMANVSSVMTSGVQGVRSALTDGFSGMSSAVTSAMSSIQSAVSSGMSSVTSTMTSGVNSVKSALTSGFQNMATTVTTQMNKIKSTITTAMNNINSTVKTQLNNIKSTWSSTMSSIQSSTTSGMNKVKSAFTSAMSSIRSSAQSTKSSIISTFNSMYSGMYSAGASAMSGLQAGLSSRSGSVLATARSIANSVTSTINSALKVGSPSRVMKATGKDTIQGLINGMKAMLSKVESISDQIADTITDMTFGSLNTPQLAFEGGVEMSMDYYFDSAGILDALDDLTDAVIEDSQKPIEITTVTELDGREIAKGTAQYTEDELNKLQSRKSRRDQFSISGG